MIEAEPGVSAEWKADSTRMLTEADKAGCLHELLDALRTETEKSLGALQGTGQPVPPSANGTPAAKSPSPNGTHGQPAPSPNGYNGRLAPSANGDCGETDPAGDTVVKAGLERRGIYKVDQYTNGAVQPFPEVTSATNAASDHAAVWADFNL